MKKIFLILAIVLSFTLFACNGQDEEVENGQIVPEEKSEEEITLCEETFTDSRDNQTYCVVKIEGQLWMAKNMNYDNGCTTVDWEEGKDKGWCGCYDEQEENCDTYGKLYQWSASNEICPEGWRLPTAEDWRELISYLGTTPATKLKTTDYENFQGDNSSGFTVLPGGSRTPSGGFQNIESNAYFWTSGELGETQAQARHLVTNQSGVYEVPLEKAFSFSVRCISN